MIEPGMTGASLILRTTLAIAPDRGVAATVRWQAGPASQQQARIDVRERRLAAAGGIALAAARSPASRAFAGDRPLQLHPALLPTARSMRLSVNPEERA